MEDSGSQAAPSVFTIIADLISVGTIVAIILTFSDKTTYVVLGILIFMFLVGCFAVFRFGSLLKHPRFARYSSWATPKVKKGAGAITCILWGVYVGYFGFQKWPTGIFVEPRFVETYHYFGQRLGKPQSNALVIPGATDETRFKNATALWATNSFDYVLWDGTKRWEFIGETTPPPRHEWHDFNWTMQRIHPESGGPPVGDMAYAWDQSPDYWKKMGGVEWKCDSTPGIAYQEFEHGRIAGIFRAKIDADAGVIFLLFDDYQWERYDVASSPSIIFARASSSGCQYWDDKRSTFELVGP